MHICKPDPHSLLAFINAGPTCYLPTSENNKPHVRGMVMYRADEKGIILQTWNVKDLYKQLNENPDVELCFLNNEKNVQIRVSGKATIVEDLDLKKEIVEKRPFLKPWVEKMGFDKIAVFRIVKCVAHQWTRETNFLPKEYINL